MTYKELHVPGYVLTNDNKPDLKKTQVISNMIPPNEQRIPTMRLRHAHITTCLVKFIPNHVYVELEKRTE